MWHPEYGYWSGVKVEDRLRNVTDFLLSEYARDATYSPAEWWSRLLAQHDGVPGVTNELVPKTEFIRKGETKGNTLIRT